MSLPQKDGNLGTVQAAEGERPTTCVCVCGVLWLPPSVCLSSGLLRIPERGVGVGGRAAELAKKQGIPGAHRGRRERSKARLAACRCRRAGKEDEVAWGL